MIGCWCFINVKGTNVLCETGVKLWRHHNVMVRVPRSWWEWRKYWRIALHDHSQYSLSCIVSRNTFSNLYISLWIWNTTGHSGNSPLGHILSQLSHCNIFNIIHHITVTKHQQVELEVITASVLTDPSIRLRSVYRRISPPAPVVSLGLSHLDCFLCELINDLVYRKKSRAREELL